MATATEVRLPTTTEALAHTPKAPDTSSDPKIQETLKHVHEVKDWDASRPDLAKATLEKIAGRAKEARIQPQEVSGLGLQFGAGEAKVENGKPVPPENPEARQLYESAQ